VYEIEPDLVALFDGLRRAATGRDRWLLEMLASYLRSRPAGPGVLLERRSWRTMAETQTLP
jgi:hypothetical protein